MTFERAELDGVVVVGTTAHADHRGYFARFWSDEDFAPRALETGFQQCSVSHNIRAGTIRGMHYQAAPHQEIKLVRCLRGRIFDVLVDLRPESPTYKHWMGRELTDQNQLALYIPRGIAHGFQTLTDDAEVLYLIAGSYEPAFARGVRWNDPTFAIHWPRPPSVISDRDRHYPDYSE